MTLRVLFRALGPTAAAAVLLLGTVRAEGPPAAPDFNRDIQPILSDRCFTCHGPAESDRQAGLRLDTREGTFGTSKSGGTPVKPGDLDGSTVLQRIESENEALRMPPAYMGHDRLSDKQISLIRRWIEAGAAYSSHWAFVPPVESTLPTVSDPGWVRRPFDSFVLARLDAEGLRPSREASSGTWLRRVSLDLTGLPPTIEQMDAFRRDAKATGEVAYEAAVDRLLASPRYGERMTMDWLDVARYADTHGFNNDSARSMWRWRDWVINSFNANMPYDRFITEQLAGDLLEKPTLDQLIATGFNRNHVINSEGGIIEEEYRVEYVADRVRTLGMAWLGLSLECARCHDHKFDPVTQRDYYRFFAFFNSVPELGEDGRVANAAPLIHAPTQADQQRIDRLSATIAKLDREVERRGSKWRVEGPPPRGRPETSRRTAQAAVPRDADFRLRCDSEGEFPGETPPAGTLGGGVVGRACVSREGCPAPRVYRERSRALRRRRLDADSLAQPVDGSRGRAPVLGDRLLSGSGFVRVRQRRRAAACRRRNRVPAQRALSRILDHRTVGGGRDSTRAVASRRRDFRGRARPEGHAFSGLVGANVRRRPRNGDPAYP